MASGAIAVAILALAVSGCSSRREDAEFAPVSIQAVQYYAFQVKGYENTYSKRRVAVVAAVDARDFKDTAGISHDPDQGRPAVGAILDEHSKVLQRLYGPGLEKLVQDAITEAAGEAGMTATAVAIPLRSELQARGSDYIFSAKILRCWVSKTRGPDREGPSWRSVADVALDVSVFKPPFEVPFWQGQVSATYLDPPASISGIEFADDTEIYEQPGEVLSVALTRAVAGIFKRPDLHVLIEQDSARIR
jgi:hypothetical protein